MCLRRAASVVVFPSGFVVFPALELSASSAFDSLSQHRRSKVASRGSKAAAACGRSGVDVRVSGSKASETRAYTIRAFGGRDKQTRP